MAGAGYKLFNTGDVLTAAQVNTYLQEQAVMRFANAAARTTALSGVLAEGMMSYLDDTNSVEVYNGSAWVSVGSTGDITGVTAGTGISGGGTSGDVTITNSMATAIDAKGDLIVGTGADTFSRLAVGTNGHTLVADSSTSTGLKWAAASSGALTKISTTTFSNVATQDIDNLFNSTYDSYLIVFSSMGAATSADDFQLLLRYGTTLDTGAYYGCTVDVNSAGTQTNTATNAAFQITISPAISSQNLGAGYMWLHKPAGGGSASYALMNGQYYNASSSAANFFGFQSPASRNYTGIRLKSSSSNIYGTVVVYGLEK